MSVRPVLLGLYEKYFLPLQKLLLPSLQAFIIGLLPGLEEGSEIYDRWVSAGAAGSAAPGQVGPAACVCVTASCQSGKKRGAGDAVKWGRWSAFLWWSLLNKALCSLGSTSIYR